MKEVFGAIEEAKADVYGLFMLQYLIRPRPIRRQGRRSKDDGAQLYTTFLASSFRTLRFGLHEAHGRGMAMQFNYLVDKGAFVPGS